MTNLHTWLLGSCVKMYTILDMFFSRHCHIVHNSVNFVAESMHRVLRMHVPVCASKVQLYVLSGCIAHIVRKH